MSHPRNPDPSYVRHASGRTRAVWTDSAGICHFRMLPGSFGSDESRAAHAKLKLELIASSAASAPATDITIVELFARYLDYAESHYRGPDREPTGAVRQLKTAIHHARQLYAELPAVEFGPLALKAVRQKFVALGWCRKTVNARGNGCVASSAGPLRKN